MKIKQSHVEKLGFEYVGGWADYWKLGPIELYNHPCKRGWTVESSKPQKQIYSVKALNRLTRKTLKMTQFPGKTTLV